MSNQPTLPFAALPCAAELENKQRRRMRYWSGHWAEFYASCMLMLKGYRILARRKKTRFGELDLIAVRGRTLAFVEVKRRGTVEEGRWSISPTQSRRMRDAAEAWIKASPRYKTYHQRYDAVLMVPGQWLVHIPNGA